MSETELNVTISATDSGFTAAAEASAAAIDDFNSRLQRLIDTANAYNNNIQNAVNATVGVDREWRSAAASAEVFRKALGDQTNEVKALRAAMAGTEGSTNNASNAMGIFGRQTSNTTREIMVLAHEALSGRFSRIPGSLMVLTQYMGGVSGATMVMAGAFAAATLAAVHLVEWLDRIRDAKIGAESAGQFFNPNLNQASLDKYVMQLRKLHDVSTEEAGATVAEFARMKGMSEPLLDALVAQVQKYAMATGDKLPQAAANLKRAFESPTEDGLAFLNSINASTAAIEKFNNISGDGAVAQKRLFMLDELAAKTKNVSNRYTETSEKNINMLGEEEAAVDSVMTAQERAAEQHRRDLIANMSNEEKSRELSKAVTWFQHQQEGAEELKAKVIGAATDFRTAQTQAATALADYWHKAETQAVQGSRDQLRAHEEYLRNKEMADLGNLRTGARNARSELEAQIAAINAQQAAAKGNWEVILSLESQKLSILRQAYGENSRQYQQELERQTKMLQQHVAETAKAAEEEYRVKARLDQQSLTAKTHTLNAEVAAGQISRDEAIDQLRKLVEANETAEQKILDDLISKLGQGTKEWQRAMDQRTLLQSRANTQIETLNAQQTTAVARDLQRQTLAFGSMFSNIGRMGVSTASGLITGTETWLRAEQRIAQTIIGDFLEMGTHILGTWIATELAKTAISTTQNAVRTAQEAGGTGLEVLIGRTLAGWLGMETSKTAITLGQSSARAAEESASGAAALAATGVMNVEEAMSYAAVGAAAAGASVAAIPVTGWTMTPEVTAGTYTLLSSYAGLASLDVGAWNVPHDMVAQIHKGEMVVPATFAEGMRSSDTFNNSSSNTSFNYAPQFHGVSNDMQRQAINTANDFKSYLTNITRNGNLKLPGR